MRRGFSLPELLVSMSMMVAVMVVLIGMYSAARGSFDYGNARLQLQQRCRETLQRISVDLVTAIPGPTGEAIVSPPANNVDSGEIVFYTSEDFLAAEQTTAPNTNRSEYWDPTTDLPYFLYRIRYDANQQSVFLEKLSQTTPGNYVVLSTRGLGGIDRGPQAPRLTSVTFRRLSLNSVRVRVELEQSVRGDNGSLRTVRYALESASLSPAAQP